MTEKGITAKAANSIAFLFTLIILIFAASGPLSELVRWIIEVTTEGFDELPRRDKRMLFREHPLGAGFKSFERSFLLPTGLILGLPMSIFIRDFVLIHFDESKVAKLGLGRALHTRLPDLGCEPFCG